MPDLHAFVSPQIVDASDDVLVDEAAACLDRFTDAFNACDAEGMDRNLHFPHVMYSGSDMLVWESAGQHPPDFFSRLEESGWAKTLYESKEAVLATKDKVHFRVAYTRCDIQNRVISRHANLWIATKIANKWGIVLRSY